MLHLATCNVIDGMTVRFHWPGEGSFMPYNSLVLFQHYYRTNVWQEHDNGKKAIHYLCVAPSAAFYLANLLVPALADDSLCAFTVQLL